MFEPQPFLSCLATFLWPDPRSFLTCLVTFPDLSRDLSLSWPTTILDLSHNLSLTWHMTIPMTIYNFHVLLVIVVEDWNAKNCRAGLMLAHWASWHAHVKVIWMPRTVELGWCCLTEPVDMLTWRSSSLWKVLPQKVPKVNLEMWLSWSDCAVIVVVIMLLNCVISCKVKYHYTVSE